MDGIPVNPLEAIARKRALMAHLRQEMIPQINAILGYSEMLREDAEGSGQEELAAGLGQIRALGKRMLTITNSYLGSSKTGTIRLDFNVETLCERLSGEMKAPVDETILCCSGLIEGGGGQAGANLGDDLGKILQAGESLRIICDGMVDLARNMTAVALPEPAGEEVGSASEAAGRRLEKGTILVVEGNDANRELLCRQLEREGHEVCSVAGGAAAMEILRQRGFDLLLLDLVTGDMSGLELLRKLKSNAGTADIPVIMISSLDEIDSVVRCIEAGAEDYLVKPFNTVLMRARTGAALEKKRLRDQEKEMIRQLKEDQEKQAGLLRELASANWELAETMDRLKETQEKLIVQEKLASLGALTAGIAHEIKNPLNFVTNFATLTVDLASEIEAEIGKFRQAMDEDASSYLDELLGDLRLNAEKINEHGRRADAIVRSMLLHSSGNAGQWQKTDINALAAEFLNLAYHGMRAQSPTFNLTLETDYDPAVEPIEAVSQDLGRVLLNLFNNACFALDEKKKKLGDSYSPVLSVRTRRLGSEVEIRIRDNGSGIPKDVVEKIFNPFFTTKPPGQGTGLGLSISHEIMVREHNGDIRVESQEGEFTEFVLTLPVK